MNMVMLDEHSLKILNPLICLCKAKISAVLPADNMTVAYFSQTLKFMLFI